MRLLNTTALAIYEFDQSPLPPYAALWTTWPDQILMQSASASGILIFNDAVSQTLRNASYVARYYWGLDWLWADILYSGHPSQPLGSPTLDCSAYFNLPSCIVCIVVIDDNRSTHVTQYDAWANGDQHFIPDSSRPAVFDQQFPHCCSKTDVTGQGCEGKHLQFSTPKQPKNSIDAAVGGMSQSHCAEGGVHDKDSGQLVRLPVRVHPERTPRPSSQERAMAKHDGVEAGSSGNRGLKRQAPREWELIERPVRAKSVKMKFGQSASSNVAFGIQNPADQPTSWEEGHSDTDSRSLFDMIGDSSMEPPTLDPLHQFAAFKDDLVDYALCEASAAFNTAIQDESVECLSDPEDNDLVEVKTHPRYLCPFYANDKERHRDCLKAADLTNILEVKRHVCRHHRLPYYCPICFEIYSNATERDDHIRGRTCSRQSKVNIEGVGEDQVELLAKVSKRMSATKQWYAIFNIVLPQTPLPPRARLSGRTELVVSQLRSFWAREGARIVSKFVAHRLPALYDSSTEIDEEKLLACYEAIPNEERSLAALHNDVIAAMIGKVLDSVCGRLGHGWGKPRIEMVGTEEQSGNRHSLIELLSAGLPRMGIASRNAKYHNARTGA